MNPQAQMYGYQQPQMNSYQQQTMYSFAQNSQAQQGVNYYAAKSSRQNHPNYGKSYLKGETSRLEDLLVSLRRVFVDLLKSTEGENIYKLLVSF